MTKKEKAQKAFDAITNATHVWLAFAPCGCVTGVATDIPMCGEDVGKWIKKGLRVERFTFEAYRNMKLLHGSQCPHKQVQQSLLGAL